MCRGAKDSTTGTSQGANEPAAKEPGANRLGGETAVTGTFVPTFFRSLELRSLELSLPRAKTTWNFRSQKGKIAWNFRSPLSKNVTKCTHDEQGSQDVASRL